ncbi:MAG: thrombospondin type 3 repeat-containing protein [bacterium]
MKSFAALILLAIMLIPTFPVKAVDLNHAVLYDMPDSKIVKHFGRTQESQLSSEDTAAIASYRFDGDTLKFLGILVEWSDRPGTWPQETFDSMFFTHGVYPNGSIADYFEEVSYGQVAVTGQVIDWFDAGIYNSGFDFETLLWQLDPYVDFSQFDGNNDGEVDAICFIRSGTGEEDSGDPNDIWSYALKYSPGYGVGPFDGVLVSAWNTSPEMRPLRIPEVPIFFSGLDTLNRIRVFCHETTHNLGLPDMYDYDAKLDTTTYFTPNDDNDHPFMDWCLMGYYGYGIFSLGTEITSHICGWNKMQIGWIDPVVLEGTHENLVIYDIEAHKDSSLYKININTLEGEYFLLEYRNPNSTAMFDKVNSDFSCYFWPLLSFGGEEIQGGLLITHVHDSLGAPFWRINYGTPEYDHYTLAVEDAGYHPTRDRYYNPEGDLSDSAKWWYPYETRLAATFTSEVEYQNEFSPTTNPSSDGYFGPSGITVRVDSIVGDKLYAYVSTPDVPDMDDDGVADSIDNCIEVYNPDQLDADHDGIGDICDECTDSDGDGYGNPGLITNTCPDDNCPYNYNPGQEDADNNGIGDVCQASQIWDTLFTGCTDLIVGSFGNVGSNGNYNSNLAYSNYGDCDPSASIYLYDGSPVFSYIDGNDTVLEYSTWYNNNTFQYAPGFDNSSIETIDMGDYEIFESVPVTTSDQKIAFIKTFWAPKQTDSCTFIIQKMKIYSQDGLPHPGLMIGELIDWDIPSDDNPINIGYFNDDYNLAYLQGWEYNGTGCQPNSNRFGGHALLGTSLNDTCNINTLASLYGAFHADNSTYVYPNSGFFPGEVYQLMAQSGNHVYGPNESDFCTMITYFGNYTLGAQDTLEIYTVLSTVENGSPIDLFTNVIKAKKWMMDHIYPCGPQSCCNHDGIRGDATDDGSVLVDDLVLLVNYLFKGGVTPNCLEEGDANASGIILVDDLTLLVNYLFKGGSAPYPCPTK